MVITGFAHARQNTTAQVKNATKSSNKSNIQLIDKNK